MNTSISDSDSYVGIIRRGGETIRDAELARIVWSSTNHTYIAWAYLVALCMRNVTLEIIRAPRTHKLIMLPSSPWCPLCVCHFHSPTSGVSGTSQLRGLVTDSLRVYLPVW
jgi:hypothetical protein